MKRIVALVLVGLVAFSALGAPASAQKKKKKKKAPPPQVVEGSIALPAVFAQGQFSGCWGGLTRRLTTPTGEESSPFNGAFGYRFVVEKSTWNKPFKLEVTGGSGTVDLDLFLYTYIPPPEETADDPVNGGTPVSVDFTDRGEGGEKGIVPKETTHGIVCLYGGADHYGYDASFKYTAGAGVK